jgi:hypothetical protein
MRVKCIKGFAAEPLSFEKANNDFLEALTNHSETFQIVKQTITATEGILTAVYLYAPIPKEVKNGRSKTKR